jgi:PAS domain S-box-containing protein
MDTKDKVIDRYGLPTRFFMGALAVTFFIIAAHSAYSWRLRRDFHNLYTEHVALDLDLARLLALDQAMTLAAHMAAVSGKREQGRRYHELELKVEELIAALRGRPYGPALAPALDRLDAANLRMIGIERAVIARGERKAAGAAVPLTSPEYLRQKQTYAEAMRRLEAASEALTGGDSRALRRLRLKDTLAGLVALGFSLFAWLAAMAAIRRWRRGAPATLELLREKEELYRHLYNNVQEVAYTTDLAGRLTDITPSIKKYSGFTREELLGRPVHEVYQDPRERRRLLMELLAKGEVDDYEVNLKTKNARPIVVSVNAHLRRGLGGIPTGVEGTLRDITARKRNEAALRENAEKLQAILLNSPAAIVCADPEGAVNIWNPAAERMFGWTESEALGRRQPLLTAERAGEFRAFMERIRAGETIHDYETESLRKDGSVIPISVSGTPLRGADGKICGVMGVIVDISGRKRAGAPGAGCLT